MEDELRSWGAGLDPRARGRALAAAGVVASARRRAVGGERGQVLASAVGRAAVPWSLTAADVAGVDPLALAEAWQTAVLPWLELQPTGTRLRLALEPPTGGLQPAWLLELLARAEPGAIALHQRIATPPGAVRWGWPLDVGVAATPGADAIRALLVHERLWWAEQFTRVAPAGRRAAPVDLLLARVSDLADARSLLDEPLRAGGVLLLQAPGMRAALDAGDLAEIREHAGAFAIGIVQVPGDALAGWLPSLVFELAHDHPLDVALAHAADEVGTAPPLLLSDERALRSARLSELARRLERRRDAVRPPELDLGPMRGGDGGFAGLPYEHETGAASVQANEAPALERELDVATAPRYLQAGITAERDEGPDRFLAAVTAGRPFFVHARIGPADAGWASADAAVPEDDLEFPGGDEPVTVILLAPELLDAPLVGALALPQSGPSKPCTFALPAPPGPGRLRAELLLLHEQRLLQTAVLSAPIVDRNAAAPAEGVQVSVGAVVRRSLHDLAGRRPFDAAILTGSATGGDAAVAVSESGRVDFIAPAGWQVTADAIRAELNKATTDAWGTQGLRDRKVVDLLIKLANMGEPLHQALLNAWGEQTVKKSGLLQVVSAQHGTYFPLEFVYDRPAPVQGAELCPHAEDALRDGRCAADCPSLDDDGFVCPLGFWGLARVIEHEDRSGPPLASEFSILSEPTRARKRLSAPVGALVGVSEKVDKVVPDATAKLAAAVLAATGSATTVKAWDAWVARVKEKHPPLLVLVPHTEPHPFFGNVALEIGTELLAASQIKAKHVCPTKEHQPVVILLGCDTAAAASPLEGLPAQFHNDGAAIVLGTLTEVLGRHAAPVAGQVVEALVRRAADGETYFGELVRDIRCRLLAQGLPLGMSLVAYGDADWVLPAS